MSIFKEKSKPSSKKPKKKEVKTTLDHRHNTMISGFNAKENDIPILEKKLKLINKSLGKFSNKPNSGLSADEIDDKLTLKEEKEKIMLEISNLKNNLDKDNYLLDTTHLLYHYFDEDTKSDTNVVKTSSAKKTVIDFFSSNSNNNVIKEKTSDTDIKDTNEKTENDKLKHFYQNKKDIMHKYFKIVNDEYVPNDKVDYSVLDICVTCNESRIFDSIHGVLICPKCGCEEKILIDSDTPSYKEPPREITYFAYKKINHANEFLSQFQAKESTDIDNDIFEKIVEELKKEAYLDIKNITSHKVREILKKLELTKYYEHCHYITNRLTGKPAPSLNSELEEKLRNMFKEVQGPWMNYCPNERANFFSYPYIFYKFFQLLDKDEYLPYCRLLKSREKLQEHDEVWKKICKHLKWQFIPTV